MNPANTPADSIVVGTSARMQAVFEFLRVIGPSESTVLVTGESGTGKEVTATLIHQASPRRHRPFVAVSCALFTETLIESELFGHERGAFTGAIKDRPGRFEMAESGTIFLDDIDDIPLSMQVKLLGNVRELENACERMAQTCTCGTVRVGCVAASILFRAGAPAPQAARPASAILSAALPEARISLDDRLREVETNLISWALRESNGNRSRAAELLRIKRSTLGDRIKHCGLDRRAVVAPADGPAAR